MTVTHGEREARLLVRVARLQRSVEALRADLYAAGLVRSASHADAAASSLSVSRSFLMSAIRTSDTAAVQKP